MKCDTMDCPKDATLEQKVALKQPRSAERVTTLVHVCDDHRWAMLHTPGLEVLTERSY